MDLENLNEKLTNEITILKLELAIVKTKLDTVTKQLEGITANIKWWVAGTIFPTLGMMITLFFTKGFK